MTTLIMKLWNITSLYFQLLMDFKNLGRICFVVFNLTLFRQMFNIKRNRIQIFSCGQGRISRGDHLTGQCAYKGNFFCQMYWQTASVKVVKVLLCMVPVSQMLYGSCSPSCVQDCGFTEQLLCVGVCDYFFSIALHCFICQKIHTIELIYTKCSNKIIFKMYFFQEPEESISGRYFECAGWVNTSHIPPQTHRRNTGVLLFSSSGTCMPLFCATLRSAVQRELHSSRKMLSAGGSIPIRRFLFSHP